MDMDTSKDSWNACLQYRNKQLTKQLKDYQKVSALTKCSSSLIVAMGQLLCLHQKPSYGIIKDEAEWRDLFIVIDLFYGGVFKLSEYDKLLDKNYNDPLVHILLSAS